MENLVVPETRSRSRSKTPFLRSNCDGENCMGDDDHTHTHHKSGRKTPVKRSTPIKQLHPSTTRNTSEAIIEQNEEHTSSRAHHTRQSTRTTTVTDKLIKTSDYSSEESIDRLKESRKEILQNEINSQYERVSTSSQPFSTLADVTLSPIHASHNITLDRSTRYGSPYSGSACSTDSSFAEQALADASVLLDREHSSEHLPYRLYKMAGEYWNKYPKTDYTYSPLSKDRVELAPGQVAVPNMSRRSLSQFRVQGPSTSADEIDRLTATTAWSSSTLRKRYNTVESSDDEGSYAPHGNGNYYKRDERWAITRFFLAIITTITTTTTNAYRAMVGPSHRYPYTDRRPSQPGLLSRTASVAIAPFYWVYTLFKKVITTTVTTVTETITPNHVSANEKYIARTYHQSSVARRSRWPWLLLLLLPIFAYGSYYTYENFDRIAMPNFTDFRLDLSEFSAMELPKITLPALPNITRILPKMDLTLPDINITLPDITDNLPEVKKTYHEYKDIVQNRMADASDYMKVVATSCYEEIKRFWGGMIG